MQSLTIDYFIIGNQIGNSFLIVESILRDKINIFLFMITTNIFNSLLKLIIFVLYFYGIKKAAEYFGGRQPLVVKKNLVCLVIISTT